jgi:hypothetical protein
MTTLAAGRLASVKVGGDLIAPARGQVRESELEAELELLGGIAKHSKPYDPQTCGTVDQAAFLTS